MHGAVLGVSAAGHQGGDAVAHFPFAHGAIDRDDFAGDLEAGNVGSPLRRWIESHALHHVGPVHSGRRDLHQDFARAGRRHRAILGNENLRSAGRADTDGSHTRWQGRH
jgi:hypothetical protein